MRTTLLFLLSLWALWSCDNEERVTLNGEFIYLADAAVLNTGTDVYGVVINMKMHELDSLCRPYKIDDFTMVPVTVEGIIIPNPEEEGWRELVEIKKIIEVEKPKEEQNIILIDEKERDSVIIN